MNEIDNRGRLQELTDRVIASNDFEELDIPLSTLNIERSQFIGPDMDDIFMPFNGIDERKGVIALFNDKKEITSVVFFEVLTNVQTHLIESQIKNGNFNGTFLFRSKAGSGQLNLVDSKIVSQTTTSNKVGDQAQVQECKDITKPGGAYDCAGARFAQMNVSETIACVAGGFVPCFAWLVISCLEDGCVVSPQVPQ